MDRTDLAKMIGLNIRKIRNQKSLSQENLALDAGIHPAYLGQLERGEKCPNIDTLLKISEALEISISKLIEFEETDYSKDNLITQQRITDAINKLPSNQRKQMVNIIENMVEMFISVK